MASLTYAIVINDAGELKTVRDGELREVDQQIIQIILETALDERSRAEAKEEASDGKS